MPLYEYECDACHHRFEVIQKFSDPLVEICPKCGAAVHKLASSPAIQFKGSGWYITDYAKKDGPTAVKTDATGDQPSSPKEGSAEQGGSSKDKDGAEAKKSGSGKDAAPKAAGVTPSAAPSPASGDSTPKASKTSD